MTIETFLTMLEGVKQRGSRWSAKCPSHADKSPSLSVSEGERGLLVKCWAGCTTEEICAALGIKIADLFFDAGVPHSRRSAPRPPQINRRSLAFQFEIGALDLRLRAGRIVETGKYLDVATLTNHELNRALAYVARGRTDEERAELFEHIADSLRAREFTERDYEKTRRAA